MKKRTRVFSAILAAILVVLSVPFTASASTQKPADLKFGADGKFKIIQVSDLQEFIVSSDITRDFIRAVAAQEKPDLFVLTGDNIADAQAASYASRIFMPKEPPKLVSRAISAFMDTFDDIGVPVTMVFGNHDAEGSGVTRAQQFDMYKEHSSFIGINDESVQYTTDEYGFHKLGIAGKDGNTAFNLYLFDSGDYIDGAPPAGFSYNCVDSAQVARYKTLAAAEKVPSLAFQHIVPLEVYEYLEKAQEGQKGSIDSNTYPTYEMDAEQNWVTDDLGKAIKSSRNGLYAAPDGTAGTLLETPTPSSRNYGQVEALREGGTLAVFYGHDHLNCYELKRDDYPDLVATPIASYGSYPEKGEYPEFRGRGLRVITLDENDLSVYETELIYQREFYAGDVLNSYRVDLYDRKKTNAYKIDRFVVSPFAKMLAWFKNLFA